MKFEQGPIRPPSESSSLLIRITRNCPWNRCLFCPVYKAEKFSRRSPGEIEQDIQAAAAAVKTITTLAWQKGCGGTITREILSLAGAADPDLLPVALWLYHGTGAVFLQDGDSLQLPTPQLVKILTLLKREIPGIKRITTYARARSLLRKPVDELVQLKEAGLDRIHVGLESGYDPVLAYMQKGVTGAEQVEAGSKVKAAGISLSEYVILGLGGARLWREHALATAAVLNAVDPDFIRVRTLTVHPLSPLYPKWQEGEFTVLDDDGVVREEELLLKNLRGIGSTFCSDHILNLLEEIEGELPADRAAMLGVIERYFALPGQERERFRLGRRIGIYRTLGDRLHPGSADRVERLYQRLLKEGLSVDRYIRQVMLGYL